MSKDYRHIQKKEDYTKLLESGMFWELHPELTGNWEVDKAVILSDS
jgi:phenylalanyl-tRNA synthetase beta subunit